MLNDVNDINETKVVNNDEQVDGTTEKETPANLDMDKFNKSVENKKETKNDEVDYKAKYEAEKIAAEKTKRALDKKMSELAQIERERRENAKVDEDATAQIAAYEAKIAEYELDKRKSGLKSELLTMGIGNELSDEFVSSIYNEEAGVLDIGGLTNALSSLITYAHETAYEKGYETREKEMAAGKPRSVNGNPVGLTAQEKAAKKYVQQMTKK